MLPFCGYHMGDYFKHWIEMGAKLGDKAPKIFNVNWFRVDDEGNFMWPGFGENMRILDWIIQRCEDKVGAAETAIGYVPNAADINIDGLDNFNIDMLKSIIEVDNDKWAVEAQGIEEFYTKFGDRLPCELKEQLATLKANLAK